MDPQRERSPHHKKYGKEEGHASKGGFNGFWPCDRDKLAEIPREKKQKERCDYQKYNSSREKGYYLIAGGVVFLCEAEE